jgi:hypothetical protein
LHCLFCTKWRRMKKAKSSITTPGFKILLAAQLGGRPGQRESTADIFHLYLKRRNLEWAGNTNWCLRQYAFSWAMLGTIPCFNCSKKYSSSLLNRTGTTSSFPEACCLGCCCRASSSSASRLDKRAAASLRTRWRFSFLSSRLSLSCCCCCSIAAGGRRLRYGRWV